MMKEERTESRLTSGYYFNYNFGSFLREYGMRNDFKENLTHLNYVGSIMPMEFPVDGGWEYDCGNLKKR